MRHWLIKSEPDAYSIADLARDGRTAWEGVRNHQAKNHMRAMEVGDPVLFYHSSCDDIGVYGVAEVAAAAHPDATQYDAGSDYHDPAATREAPRWWCVDVKWVETFPHPVLRDAMKETPGLAEMQVLQKGARLSVQPVTAREFAIVRTLGRGA